MGIESPSDPFSFIVVKSQMAEADKVSAFLLSEESCTPIGLWISLRSLDAVLFCS